MAPHPLHNISDGEISRATSIVKQLLQKKNADNGTEKVPWFKSVSLAEPPKSVLLPYLDAEAAGVPVSQRPFVPRCLEVIYSTDGEREVVSSIISLDSGTEVNQEVKHDEAHGANDR